MYIFQEKEIKKHVHIDFEAIKVVEQGFTSLAEGKVVLPPIMRIDIPEYVGEVDVKSAYIKGLDTFAIKISSGFFQNHLLGLPSLSGMMILFDSKTGFSKAILLDNGYLTDVRTAVAGAIAAKFLAKKKVERVGVIGTGTQARYQIEALAQVRDFQTIYVYGRREDQASKYAQHMEKKLGKRVVVAQTAEEVVKESEIVVTTTPSPYPLLKSGWLHPGLHITAIGSDAEHKQELDSVIFGKADRIVCDVKAQCFRLGELHHALEQGMITKDCERIFELGELTSRRKAGRQDDKEITVCDLTGTGVQDTVIARYAVQKLTEVQRSN